MPFTMRSANTKNHKLAPATLCVHAGAGPDPLTGAVMTPIYLTSTYAQEAPGRHKGFEYSRTQNPTRQALEAALAALEKGSFACAFASGLAAEDAVLRLLRPGDEVLACQDLYGGSYRLMHSLWRPYGLNFKFIDMTKMQNLKNALSAQTRLIWIETPSNPLLKIIDIAAVAQSAGTRSRSILVCVDNTFATPILQTPLELGADLVVHSTTKYIGGHSDIIGGCVVGRAPDLEAKIKHIQNAAGAVPGPMDCFLALRGIKTLALRVKKHCGNGAAVATFLSEQSQVHHVYYPGLAKYGARMLAQKQMADFGGMLSFELHGGKEKTLSFFSKLKIFTLAESLGGVESLACYPWTMTHAAIPEKERVAAGIKDNLIRLSVGIEDPRDLIADLENALN